MVKVKIIFVLLVILDVVPVGAGWKQPPFSGYVEDGVIYSRGILDNKGPILIMSICSLCT